MNNISSLSLYRNNIEVSTSKIGISDYYDKIYKSTMDLSVYFVNKFDLREFFILMAVATGSFVLFMLMWKFYKYLQNISENKFLKYENFNDGCESNDYKRNGKGYMDQNQVKQDTFLKIDNKNFSTFITNLSTPIRQ